MRISNLALAILMAVSLCWVLFAQDQAAVFEIDPTSDLPEMMTNVETNTTPQERPPPASVASVPSQIAPVQTAPRSITNDDLPCACAAPLVWQLNNPPTAPPAA